MVNRRTVVVMNVSYDLDAGAVYVQLTAERVARTGSVGDLMMVDLNEHGEPVGVDFALSADKITAAMLDRLGDAYPALKGLRDTDSWLFVAA